ncbi:putative bifunctional diguanylate cyclase/phosphodiesterase [Neobacillus sp. K501]
MYTHRKLPPITILVYVFLYYFWIILFKDNKEILTIGSDLLQITAPIIAFFWLFHTYNNTKNKNRSFWLFLAIGCLSFIIGEAIWNYYELFLQLTPPYPSWADLFWLLQYVFYIFAFGTRMYFFKHSFTTIRFFIDTVIVMVVAVVLNWEFIIHPAFKSLDSNSVLFNITYLGYPIGDLFLLSSALSLFLISDATIPRKSFLLIIFGFLINFIVNSSFSYLVINNSYNSGNFIDPLWALSNMLVGLAGLYANVSTGELQKEIQHHRSRHFLSLFSVTILLVFTIRKHYQIMEVLTYGLAFVIVLLMIRLVITLTYNEKLLFKQEELTEDLLNKNLELQTMNQNLSEKEQQLNDVFNNLDAVIMSIDLQTKKIITSPGVEKIFGFPTEDLQRNHLLWKEAVHPEDKEVADEIDLTISQAITKTSLHVFRTILPGKQIKWIQLLRTPILDDQGQLIKINGVFTDITEHKKAEEQIEYMAYYDDLTRLPNRNLFYKRLNQEMVRASENQKKLAVMFMDLDRFKTINDSLGHHIGDLLLQAVSERLKTLLNDHPIISRIGGDEFTIVLPSDQNSEYENLAKEVIELFTRPFLLEGHEIFITPSIGISLFPDHGNTEDELIKKADLAMYYAKDRGKNNFYVYTTGLEKIHSRKMKLENYLRRAIEKHELSLHYQPKVELTTGKIIGMEALIRWNHPILGNISPLEFIPLAEESGLIISIGEWVLKTACQQNKEWQKFGVPCIPISVNVSARQLNSDIVGTVFKVLQETQLDPSCLELEITESVMQNINESSLILNELKDLGIQLSLDDFGTGYSSLSYLSHLPVDSVKIDRSFIHDILNNNGGILVKTIIDMGRNLNFSVIAEGVENEQQIRFLRENNCFIAQGYYYSPPVPKEKMLPLLLQSNIKNIFL